MASDRASGGMADGRQRECIDRVAGMGIGIGFIEVSPEAAE
jgi:hypothetical protein